MIKVAPTLAQFVGKRACRRSRAGCAGRCYTVWQLILSFIHKDCDDTSNVRKA